MIHAKFQKSILGLSLILKIENVTHVYFMKNVVNVGQKNTCTGKRGKE